MYLTVQDKEYDNYICIDVLSGIQLQLIQKANDDTGEFSCYMYDDDGLLVCDSKKEPVLFDFIGKIKLIKKDKYENR